MLAVILIFVEFNHSLIYIIQLWNNYNYSCIHVCMLDIKDEMKLKILVELHALKFFYTGECYRQGHI